MLVGMGTVFVFLTALVTAMTLMAAIAKRFQPKPTVSDGVSDDEVAAIGLKKKAVTDINRTFSMRGKNPTCDCDSVIISW